MHRAPAPAAPVGRRCSRGWSTLLICLVLLGLSVLSTAWIHRSVVERERLQSHAWARLQAQALGHGAMMWALERLQDARPIDEACQPRLGHGPTDAGTSFAGLLQTPGSQVTCRVDLNAVQENGPWRCTCRGAVPSPVAEPLGPPGTAHWMLQMTARDKAWQATLQAAVFQASAPAAYWREATVLRRDAAGMWHMVVGSWTDSR